MSINDGKMKDNTLYLTSDIWLAGYLLLRGYECYGAVDTGSRRKEFGITSTDPVLLDNMFTKIQALADEYENQWLPLPHDKDARVNFKQYHHMIKSLHHHLDNPVRPKQ